MKNFFKYLSFFLIALIIILVSLYLVLTQKKIITINLNPAIEKKVKQPLASTTSFAQEPMGTYTTMTNDERTKLRLAPDLKVEVIRRSASGTPTDYRIVK